MDSETRRRTWRAPVTTIPPKYNPPISCNFLVAASLSKKKIRGGQKKGKQIEIEGGRPPLFPSCESTRPNFGKNHLIHVHWNILKEGVCMDPATAEGVVSFYAMCCEYASGMSSPVRTRHKKSVYPNMRWARASPTNPTGPPHCIIAID